MLLGKDKIVNGQIVRDKKMADEMLIGEHKGFTINQISATEFIAKNKEGVTLRGTDLEDLKNRISAYSLLGKHYKAQGEDKKTVDETKVFENWKGLEVGKTYQQPDGRKFKVLKEEYSGVGGRTPFITVKYLDSKTKDASYRGFNFDLLEEKEYRGVKYKKVKMEGSRKTGYIVPRQKIYGKKRNGILEEWYSEEESSVRRFILNNLEDYNEDSLSTKDSKTKDGLNVDPEERIAIKRECDEIMASVGGDTKLFTNTVMKLSFGVPPAEVVRWYLGGAKDSKTKDAEYPEVYKGFYIHLQSNDKLEGYRNDSKGNTKSFVKNTWNELKSAIDKYWADNPNGDSLDDEDILTLDEKEMEEFFVKDAPPNYYGAIVAVAQSANNPLATREYVRKQIEPFMRAKGVPFVENEFNQVYSEFNKAGASKAAFFKGRDAAGDLIENYHGFEIKETNTGVNIFLGGSPVMNAVNVVEAHREIDKYRAERKANFQKGVKNMDSESVKTKQELLTEMVDHFKSKTYDEAIEIAHYFPVVKVEEALMKGGFNKSISQAGSRYLGGIITKDQFRAVESKSRMVRHYSVKTDKMTKDARDSYKDVAQSAGLTGGISPSEYNAEKKLLQDQLSKAVASGNTFKAKEVEKELATLEQEFKTKDASIESELKVKNPAAWHGVQIAKKTLRMPDAMLGVMGGPSKEEAKEILKKYGIPFTEDSKTKDAVLEFNNVLVSVNKSSNGKFLAIARVNGQNQKVEGSTEQEAVSGIRQIIEEKTTQR